MKILALQLFPLIIVIIVVKSQCPSNDWHLSIDGSKCISIGSDRQQFFYASWNCLKQTTNDTSSLLTIHSAFENNFAIGIDFYLTKE